MLLPTPNQSIAINKAISRLSHTSAPVITMRLTLMPMQWMLNPTLAQRETQRMFIEKRDAFFETQWTMMTLPFLIWSDFLQAGIPSPPQQLFIRASSIARKAAFEPSQRRASANSKRLSASVKKRS